MKVIADKKVIDEILTRSVAEILPTKEKFREALESGRRLRIYIGTDATGTSLHIGHATNYMILEKLRRLGHQVIFLVGDFTARIGDPTDKNDSARKRLTRKQILRNVKTWIHQIKPVIDLNNKKNPAKILYNHNWLSALTLEDVIDLASNFTFQQLIERDMFQARIKSGKPLYVHELLYPLMQGYDSVAMNIDAELCGTDQKFNALAGRTLLKKLKNKEKFVFITTLLENPKTGKKMMSKSTGTGVFLDFDPDKMYGAVMAQPDENMRQLLTDCTWLELKEIDEILKAENPRDAKMRLALEITKIYHGERASKNSERNFIQTFQKNEIPGKIPTIGLEAEEINIIDLLLLSGVKSKSEARRLINQKAVDVREVTIENPEEIVILKEPAVLKVGKKRFFRVVCL